MVSADFYKLNKTAIRYAKKYGIKTRNPVLMLRAINKHEKKLKTGMFKRYIYRNVIYNARQHVAKAKRNKSKSKKSKKTKKSKRKSRKGKKSKRSKKSKKRSKKGKKKSRRKSR